MSRNYDIIYDGASRGSWQVSGNAITIRYGDASISVDSGTKTINCDSNHVMGSNLINS